MLKAHSSWDQVRGTLRPMRPLFGAFQTRDYPVHPTQALISSAELSPFLARTGREAAAGSQGPQRPVQAERRQVGVAPHSSPGIHTTSSFTTVKCLAKAQCSQEVGSHTEQQSPGPEANCWPCPQGPAPFPVQCPCWDDQHLNGTGKDGI
uniref:Uncharacterized protein n=1 Tax=Myotis myotis TaxID=51298 RepID=A0A7J7U590_MYOMY|nr:hypothetical protein mMyoMyo1_008832 [Myotis myotis]